MSISTFEARATNIRFDEDNLWLNLADGRQLSVPLVYFPRLHKCDESFSTRKGLRSAVAARACTGMKSTKISAFPTCYRAFTLIPKILTTDRALAMSAGIPPP